jgi:hypothetical protein
MNKPFTLILAVLLFCIGCNLDKNNDPLVKVFKMNDRQFSFILDSLILN